MTSAKHYDVVIIGAGAAGLMCAIEAGKRGRSVLLIDHAKKPAEKIRISGGGRCNFTNLHASPANYISQNPKFCISALKRYTQQDFIALVKKHRIAYHEKTLGQLFCDGSSQEIITMLLDECEAVAVELALQTSVSQIDKNEAGFQLQTTLGAVACESLVIASGGKSIPKMGATGFGYDVAKQFGLNIMPTDAALVPFMFEGEMLEFAKSLAGTALDVTAKCNKTQFDEAMLYTHRGLSGPAILQISSYWKSGGELEINLSPKQNIFEFLCDERKATPKQKPASALAKILPKRLAAKWGEKPQYDKTLADLSNKVLQQIADEIHHWKIKPSNTEGYRTAEVTVGGVDTNELSSSTMETKKVQGLYFIGEVVDVTGWLGGYNFQWAWSSGYVAGNHA